MTSSGLHVQAWGDNEIVMSRAFDAPRGLVFDAWTKPDLLKRWLGVFGGWTLAECEIDLKPGGAYRFVWLSADGAEMGARGTYRAVISPERIVNTERFDEPWYPGEALVTTVFAEKGGATTVTTTLRYESREARDGVLKSPMKEGIAASYARLAQQLPLLVAGKR